MNAIKKRLQTLKLEKDLAMDKADLCDQQAKEANRREEKLKDEVRELAKKLVQMEHDLEVSKAQLVKSNKDLEMKERIYIVVSESDKCTVRPRFVSYLSFVYCYDCRHSQNWRC